MLRSNRQWQALCFVLVLIAVVAQTGSSLSPHRENAFHLDSPVNDLQWVSDKIAYILSFEGRVYRSRNYGRSWEDQQANMRNAGHKVRQMKISPTNRNHIFFMGEGDNHIATTDMGETYYSVKAPLLDVKLHPTNVNALLSVIISPACGRAKHEFDGKINNKNSRSESDCFKQLIMSTNFGKTWVHLYDYVVQYDWSPVSAANDLTILASIYTDMSGNQPFGHWHPNVNFVVSKDLFHTEPAVLVPHGNRFLFGKHGFLFVISVAAENDNSRSLMVSKTLSDLTPESFKGALLPVELREHSYTILDASEHSVFLHVNHKPFGDNAYAGHIYISDASGTQYSISLPYNHRNSVGKCDFASVQGVEGIFLANLVDEVEMSEKTREQQSMGDNDEYSTEHARSRHNGDALIIKTVITFNKGSEWSFLDAPDVDVDGNPYKCKHDGTCHLHLHGATHGFGPFYSVESAKGIILATGMVGTFLHSASGLINTYLSEDAGLTWREIAKGSHIYEIGDHGGLIVMASDQVPTNTIMYSYDYGRTWSHYMFSTEEILIENIITENTSTTPYFMIYGTSGSKHSSGGGIVTHVSFSHIHERHCKGIDAPGVDSSDYELWTPHDGRAGNKCLLGHTATYVRRKPVAQCRNPKGTSKPTFFSHCTCTVHDFECDIGYLREKPDGPCIPDSNADVAAQQSVEQRCASNSAYSLTKGYRKIPGNTCIGGHEWEGTVVPCPNTWIASSSTSSMFLIILILFVCAGIALVKTKMGEGFLLMAKDKLLQFTSKKTGGYSQVSTSANSIMGGNSNEYDEEHKYRNASDFTLDSDSDVVIPITVTKKAPLPEKKVYTAPPAITKPPEYE